MGQKLRVMAMSELCSVGQKLWDEHGEQAYIRYRQHLKECGICRDARGIELWELEMPSPTGTENTTEGEDNNG